MKKIISTMIGFLCLAFLYLPVIAQDKNSNYDNGKEKITGSGNIVTKEVAVQPFTSASFGGVFSVVLSQGSKEEVKIEADDNLQELFEVKNEGQKLVINMKKDINFHSDKTLKVHVTFRTLEAIELKMVGSISSADNLNFSNLTIDNKSVGSINLKMTAQTLNIENKSVGNVKLNGKADKVVIKNKGVGSVDAGEFVVQTMDIENTGVGSAEVNAEKEIKVKDSFLGKVKNRGAAVIKRSNKVAI